MTNILIILGALLFLALVWGITYYNIILHSEREVLEVDHRIEKMYLSVHDKLPYLIEVIVSHKLLEAKDKKELIELRNKIVVSSSTIETRFPHVKELIHMLSDEFEKLDKKLKKDVSYLESRHELTECFEELSLLTRMYNEKVEEYNGKLTKFPGNTVGNVCRMPSMREL